MTHPDDRRYSFSADEHWRAGALDNLAYDAGALQAPPRLVLEHVTGSGPADANAVAGYDSCGRLSWLRPDSGVLLRRYDFGVEEVGRLDDSAGARGIVFGRTVVWVLTPSGLRRYGSTVLDLYGRVPDAPGRVIAGITSDGADGIWLLEVDSSANARVRHLDRWGVSRCPEIPLPGPLRRGGRMSATTDGRHLVVLEPVGPGRRDPLTNEWRLFVVHRCGEGEVDSLSFRAGSATPPTSLTVDTEDRLQLFAGGAEPWLQILSLAGERLASQALPLPAGFSTATAMMGTRGPPVVVGDQGLAVVVPRDLTTGSVPDRVSTFITPTLVSPRGPRSGWNRAELSVWLPRGTSMDVMLAGTSHAPEIAEIESLFADESLSPLDRAESLRRKLAALEIASRTYGATDVVDGNPGRVVALLDEVKHTHLWIRVDFTIPPARERPRLQGLEVHYPYRSYAEELPAVFREEPAAAAQLRRLLAPFEVLFGELDDVLSALPARIDPRTAPDDWSSFLLCWMGFPRLDDLDGHLRRELLCAAPELLATRGTIAALRHVLDIVTSGRAVVSDQANAPAGWFLPEDGLGGSVLGRDTVARAQRPAAFRAGSGAALGATPLGTGCADPGLILEHHTGLVSIVVEVDAREQETLEPIVDRVLTVFVPSHCRVDTTFTGADGSSRARRLDIDFRLAGTVNGDASGDDARLYSDAHWRLGSRSAAGRWRLPAPPTPPVVLDGPGVLNGAPRLN